MRTVLEKSGLFGLWGLRQPAIHAPRPIRTRFSFYHSICHCHSRPISTGTAAALSPPWLPVRRSRVAAPRRPLAYPPLALPRSQGWSPSPSRVLPPLEFLPAPLLAGGRGAVGRAPRWPAPWRRRPPCAGAPLVVSGEAATCAACARTVMPGVPRSRGPRRSPLLPSPIIAVGMVSAVV